MVWDSTPHAGFTSGKPWLPIKAPQQAKNVQSQLSRNDSVLHSYRSALAFRKSRPELISGKTVFIDLPEPVLAFHREGGDHRLTCIFNLGKPAIVLKVTGQPVLTGPSESVVFDGTEVHLGGNGFCYLDSRMMDAAPTLRLNKPKSAA
jgi:alpha-glucosidase